jgi:hypothetical protein
MRLLPLSLLCFLYLYLLASRMFFRFPMITRDAICLGTLRDDNFWLKTSIMQVLNCINSPRRAMSSPLRARAAEHGGCSPPARHCEFKASKPWLLPCFARLAFLSCSGSAFFHVHFYKCKLIITKPQGIGFPSKSLVK